MRLYEFEAKRLFAKHGIAVPQGKTASSAAEVEGIAAELGCPLTVRAQVVNRRHAAPQTAQTPARAKELAAELLAIDDGLGWSRRQVWPLCQSVKRAKPGQSKGASRVRPPRWQSGRFRWSSRSHARACATSRQ